MFRNSITVHPRGYGEHISIAVVLFITGGSSPWVRGTYGLIVVFPIINRFIPVGTGNILPIRRFSSRSTVHPRGYGEHLLAPENLFFNFGSSPWVRGT